MNVDKEEETIEFYCTKGIRKRYVFSPFTFSSVRILYKDLGIPIFLEE